MRALRFTLMTLLALIAAGVAHAETLSGARHVAMTLVAESDTPAAGGQVSLAIDTRPAAGWHGYWTNPGDAGLPAKLGWTLPRGATVGEAVWPVPEPILLFGLMNFAYSRPFAPLLQLHVPAGLAAGTPLPVKVHVDYLVCSESLCVPEKADVAIELRVGAGAIDPARRAMFDAWRRAIPKPLGSPASYQVIDGRMTLSVPFPAAATASGTYFFPTAAGGPIDLAAPQTVRRDGDRLIVETKAKATTGRIEGVLRTAPGIGLSLAAVPGAAPAAAPPGGVGAAVLAFVFAVLGGVILNAMPCVFPILSIKALSLARGHLDERAARGEAVAYALGVIAVCVGLGATILILRAGGAATGWAFQLTDPRAVIVLLLLSAAIALNLSGMFELPTPQFAGRSGAVGSFATGALAAFVATPCTGPFMASALGAALFMPWPAALAIFAGLGIGLALPFVAIGFVPALRRRLPKPGGWMETFRRVLGVPMWLTAVGVAWLLGHMAGVDAMTLGLLAALGVAVLLWIVGARQRRGLAGGWPAWIGVLAIAIAAAATVKGMATHGAAVAQSAGHEAFTEARLATLRDRRRPVFAYFTADWCVSCKVNERIAIDTPAVRAAFARHGVQVLIGDWTDGDPALGRFLAAQGRAGVPLYLYYRPGQEPEVLPQVLSQSRLIALAGG